MNIPAHVIIDLPLHDSSLLKFTIESNANGFLTASLRLKINPEEPAQPLKELGILSPDFCVTFQNCWQVKTNFVGYGTRPETLDAFDIDEKSVLKEQLFSFGLGNLTIIHFKIKGSGGSVLDILAESVFLM